MFHHLLCFCAENNSLLNVGLKNQIKICLLVKKIPKTFLKRKKMFFCLLEKKKNLLLTNWVTSPLIFYHLSSTPHVWRLQQICDLLHSLVAGITAALWSICCPHLLVRELRCFCYSTNWIPANLRVYICPSVNVCACLCVFYTRRCSTHLLSIQLTVIFLQHLSAAAIQPHNKRAQHTRPLSPGHWPTELQRAADEHK